MNPKLLKVELSFFAVLLYSSILSAQGWWFKKANFNQSSRTASVGFAIGTGGFIGTGYDSTSFKRNFSVYNQTNDTWTQIQSIGGISGTGLARDAASSFVIGTKAYVGLGQGSNPYFKDFWEYDSGTDTWMQKANFAGTARRGAAAFAVDNKGYVVCGQDQNGFKNDLWMYDAAANVWSAKAPFPSSARRLPVAFVVGTKAYVGTGDDGIFKNDFYKYDAIGNTWVAISAFSGTPRYGAVAFVIGTDGYVGTGYDNTLSNKKDFWKYNSLTDSWSQIQDFGGTARSNAVAFAIGNYGYVGTGYDTLVSNDLWSYDPTSNAIEEVDKFKTSINIYPNPVVSNFTIAFNAESLNSFDKISFMMYDLNGREVKYIDKLESAQISIDRDNLVSGLYLYKFIAGSHFLTSGKIIVK